MGPVESRVRAAIRDGDELATPTGAPFRVARVDGDGVVLLLGAKEASTRLTWECLEGVPSFLASGEWTPIGGKYDVQGEPGTLDGYLKEHLKRATAGWVAVLLERAGVVELDRSRPARVRPICVRRVREEGDERVIVVAAEYPAIRREDNTVGAQAFTDHTGIRVEHEMHERFGLTASLGNDGVGY